MKTLNVLLKSTDLYHWTSQETFGIHIKVWSIIFLFLYFLLNMSDTKSLLQKFETKPIRNPNPCYLIQTSNLKLFFLIIFRKLGVRVNVQLKVWEIFCGIWTRPYFGLNILEHQIAAFTAGAQWVQIFLIVMVGSSMTMAIKKIGQWPIRKQTPFPLGTELFYVNFGLWNFW